MVESHNQDIMEKYVEALQYYVQQATLNRIKLTLERELQEMNFDIDVMISTTVRKPRPIFLHFEGLDEIPMVVFEWLSEFSKIYDLKYINSRGNLFAIFLRKDYDHINEIQKNNQSLYSLYRKEKQTILEREKLSNEDLYTYNIKAKLKTDS